MLPWPGPGAFNGQPTLMRIGDRLADREAEADPAKLPRDLAIALLEGIEDAADLSRVDSDAGVFYFHRHAPVAVRPLGARADRDRATLRGELDRVLEQVPEDLGDARAVGEDGCFFVGKIPDQLEMLGLEIGPAGIDRILDHAMETDPLAMELEFAPGDAGEVEQVVD